MDNESKETPAELGEIISTASFILGIVAGYEEVASKLRAMAGDYFSRGNDTQAHIYRGLAETFEMMAKEKRAEYDTERRAQKDYAFVELEKLAPESEVKR